MNKIIKFLAIPALLMGLTSCEDWLELPSESKMDSQSAFENISRAEMTVMGCYDGVPASVINAIFCPERIFSTS